MTKHRPPTGSPLPSGGGEGSTDPDRPSDPAHLGTEAEGPVYIGMGANVGDHLAALQRALDGLATAPGVTVEAVSPVYETEAHVLPGMAPQPDHLNAIAQVSTSLAPHDLLDALHAEERRAGRDASAPRWSPRPLDLDVILWGDRAFETERLTVPHPRLAERRFVLAPLADLACDLVVPGLGRSVRGLLAATPDRARLARFPGTLTVPEADRRERP